jgi:transcriptional regulator with XRE-family HTH domain
MDDLRFGQTVRRLRIRARLRQEDLARQGGVSRTTISRVEHGRVETLSLTTIRRIAAVLEIRIDLVPRWRGGELDRVLNAAHSGLHEQVARSLNERRGWTFRPEVSFAIYAERGVVDVLAFHVERSALLVIELKTAIVDVNELISTLDRKTRLARQIAAEQGWPIDRRTTSSAWVIVAEGRTNRRRVADHRSVLRAAFPSDGRAIQGWLADPRSPMRCLSFWPSPR